MSSSCFLADHTPPPTLRTRQNGWLLAAAMPVALAPVCGFHGWTSMPMLSVTGLVLGLMLFAASVTDLKHRKIYNWTTYTAFMWAILINTPVSQIAFAMNSESQLNAIGLRPSLTGGAICFAVMMFAYALARGGAGDVKLATAIGALVGVDDGILIIALSYIFAAIAILAWTVWMQGPLVLVNAMGRQFGASILPGMISEPSNDQSVLLQKPVPLAGFFAAGTLAVLFDVPSIVGDWL